MSGLGSNSHSVNPDLLTGDSKGDDGTDGAKWLSGSGAPGSGLGSVGDWYVDLASAQSSYYEKTAVDTWTLRGELEGTDGTDGVGVPAGGTTGQVLAKASDTDYDTEWVAAGGGGGAAQQYHYESFSTQSTAGVSTSSFATKIQWIDCLTDVTVHEIAIQAEPQTGETYRVIVIEESGVTAFEVAAVVGTSNSVAQVASPTDPGWQYYRFTTPFNMEAGKGYGILIQRTDSTTTAAVRPIIISRPQLASSDFTLTSISTNAINTTPSVGQDLTGNQTANPFQIPFKVYFELTA